MKSLRIASTLAIVALSGCATQEYRNAEAYCRPQAYQQYPVINQQRWETRTRRIEVPTGKTRCRTRPVANNQNETICEDITEWRNQDYPQLVTVDINKPGRDAHIGACASDICLRKYGNADCETGK